MYNIMHHHKITTTTVVMQNRLIFLHKLILGSYYGYTLVIIVGDFLKQLIATDISMIILISIFFSIVIKNSTNFS